MDKGVPKGCWEGDDHCEHRPLYHKLISNILLQDSTIDFEKRRNVPIRYNRELLQTTVKAMKRIHEIKLRREHAFWKSRFALFSLLAIMAMENFARMSASREKLLANRKKTTETVKSSVDLVQPMELVPPDGEKIRKRIKVLSKNKGALVPGEGRSMDIEMD